MIVYAVVGCIEYEGEDVVKIFKSRSRAEDLQKELTKAEAKGYKMATFEIREFELGD